MLSADSGQCMYKVDLKQILSHSVLLTTGQYVVCFNDTFNCDVCFVCDGKITPRYGDLFRYTVRHPCHLAVDKDSQFIFVDDLDIGNVAMLSPTLEFVRYLRQGLSYPCRLYCDQTTRRLFVGQQDGRVSVIQL